MKSLTKLKNKARAHEQQEKWADAIDAYLEVIRVSAANEGEVDLPLYNRIGDLYLRAKRPKDAVAFYGKAADHYAEAGLYNNAIALCNKALRYAPGAAELYHKLAQLCSTQGFQTDARRWYLEYAEIMRKSGRMEEAFQALEEFADVIDDAETRELLGRQLGAHGKTAEAVNQLVQAYRLRVSAGENGPAESLRAEILQLDPAADLGAASAGRAKPAGPPAAAPAIGLDGLDIQSPAGAAGLPQGQGGGSGAAPDAGGSMDEEIEPLPLLEPDTASAPGPDPAPTEGIEGLMVDPIPGLEVGPAPEPPQAPGLEPMPDLPVDRTTAPPASTPASDTAPTAEAGAADPFPLLDLDSFDLDLTPGPEPTAAEEAREQDAPLPEIDLEGLDRSLTLEGAGAAADAPPADLPAMDAEPDAEDVAEPADEGDLGDIGEIWEIGAVEDVADADADEPITDLPLLGEDDSDDSVDAFGDDGGADDLPLLYEPDPADEADGFDDEGAEDLPLLLDTEPDPAADAPTHELEPEDLAVLLATESDAAAQDPAASSVSELERAHAALADEGELTEAIRVIEELIRREPGEVRRYQQRVEYAFRLGDSDLLVRCYLDLARSLASAGEAGKAATVFRRVLELDPGNEQALRAVEGAPEQPAAPAGRDYVDLGGMLREEVEADASTRFIVAEEEPTGDEDRDFADMLAQFRTKVSENVPVEDATSHYDLGLAYREMGLLDEAIFEFQTALRGGQGRLKVYEELGQCFILKEQYDVAIKVLGRALQLPFDDDAELLGVHYHLGRCYEEIGSPGEAKDAYERVIGLDVGFRDVTDRLAKL